MANSAPNLSPDSPQNPNNGPGGVVRQATFNPNALHQQRPALRPVRGFPVQIADNQVMLGVSDARQISDQIVCLPIPAQFVLPLMDGKRTLQQIIDEAMAAQPKMQGLTLEIMQSITAQLDEAGLLVGPTFDKLLADLRSDFDSLEHLPPGGSAAFGDMLLAAKLQLKEGESPTPEQLATIPTLYREQLTQWTTQVVDAATKQGAPGTFDSLPKALVAPHLDYVRGWGNYAASYGRLNPAHRPDRIIILGTNHFGMATGVTACDKGYATPLGSVNLDRALLNAITTNLGKPNADKLLANRYDHEREHSIELQIPWIQHTFGDSVPVLGVLIHDPAINAGESYDGNGLGLEPFLAATRAALASLGGKTLIISSADLSHVGPMFGDQHPLAGDDPTAGQARNKVLQHDQSMLQHVIAAKPDDLVAAMAWQQNPTRWCSTGNLVAMMKLTNASQVELLQYIGAMDEKGQSMVSSIAAVVR